MKCCNCGGAGSMVETPVGFLYLHECRPRTLEALLLDAKGPRYCRRCNQEATHQAVGGPAPCGGCYEDSLAPFINREACRREQNAASGPSRLLLNVIAALAELERTWIAEATKQRLRVLRNMGKGLGRPLVGSRDRALTGLTDAAIHAKWRELGSMQATARALGRTWAAGGIRWGALRASRIEGRRRGTRR